MTVFFGKHENYQQYLLTIMLSTEIIFPNSDAVEAKNPLKKELNCFIFHHLLLF